MSEESEVLNAEVLNVEVLSAEVLEAEALSAELTADEDYSLFMAFDKFRMAWRISKEQREAEQAL